MQVREEAVGHLHPGNGGRANETVHFGRFCSQVRSPCSDLIFACLQATHCWKRRSPRDRNPFHVQHSSVPTACGVWQAGHLFASVFAKDYWIIVSCYIFEPRMLTHVHDRNNLKMILVDWPRSMRRYAKHRASYVASHKAYAAEHATAKLCKTFVAKRSKEAGSRLNLDKSALAKTKRSNCRWRSEWGTLFQSLAQVCVVTLCGIWIGSRFRTCCNAKLVITSSTSRKMGAGNGEPEEPVQPSGVSVDLADMAGFLSNVFVG